MCPKLIFTTVRLLGLLFFATILSIQGIAQQWSALGAGIEGFATKMIEYNGELYLGGNQQFTTSGGPRVGLWKWSGTDFDTLPGSHLFGSTMIIYDMAVYQGELYLCGSWSGLSRIAKWNGSTFSSVSHLFSSVVSALEVYQGELYAGGPDDDHGGIMRWNGSQWTTVGTGLASGASIYDFVVYGSELYAIGSLSTVSGNSSGIARWDGATWKDVGPGGANGPVSTIGVHNGEIYISSLTLTNAGGIPVHQTARWNGSTWAPVFSQHSVVGSIGTITTYQGELYFGGNFLDIEGDTMKCLSRYNGSQWRDVGGGVDSAFATADTVVNPLGDTVVTSLSTITAMYEFDGELYVSGIFDKIGGVQARRIAKWSAPLRTPETISTEDWAIYPNPANDRISISGPADATKGSIEIHDMQGRILLSQSFSGPAEVNVRSLSQGIYILNCSTKTGKFTHRLAIQR